MRYSKKVNEYYNKLLNYVREEAYSGERISKLSYRNHSVKNLLNTIINNNCDYVLTDDLLHIVADRSMLDCLSRSYLYEILQCFPSNDRVSILEEITRYFITMMMNMDIAIRYKKSNFEKETRRLSKEHLNIVNTLYAASKELDYENKYHTYYHKNFEMNILYAIAAICVYEKRENDFIEYCIRFLAYRDKFCEFFHEHRIMLGINTIEFYENYPLDAVFQDVIGKVSNGEKDESETRRQIL